MSKTFDFSSVSGIHVCTTEINNVMYVTSKISLQLLKHGSYVISYSCGLTVSDIWFYICFKLFSIWKVLISLNIKYFCQKHTLSPLMSKSHTLLCRGNG